MKGIYIESKYKIGMEIELNYEFDNKRAIVTELDWHEEKKEPLLIVAIIHNDKPKTAPKDERWIYLNQVRRIIQ
tara:strand:+ start:576 stop:797 length:222 start_codon:yes stop_codon:yes gene_type:complete